MVFTAPTFLFLFLPILLSIYWLTPPRGRNLVLLAASLFFYAWGEGLFALVMLLSIAANWFLGMLVESFASQRSRVSVLVIAVSLNIGLLVFFKYWGFLTGQLNGILLALGLGPVASLSPHLPLGISFFTFHSLSYIIDIYRRVAIAQRHPVDFALYIAFFPQLIAGPIIRYHDVYRQLAQRRVTGTLLASGIERFVAGLGKKMILANPLGEVADRVFALPAGQLSQPEAWLGIICYSLQIFLDFSAYSDMAIGLARVFGFDFLENFDYPYKSRSIQEFWRRWHISLSNWFRDYLYIPLGGNRGPRWRIYANLAIVFLLCGLWHGANWTFIVWGGLHGAFLVLERLGLAALLLRLPGVVRHFYVMLVVMIAWVFFRADDVGQAVHYLGVMFAGGMPASTADLAGLLTPLVLLALAVGGLASAGGFTKLTLDWRNRQGQSKGEPSQPVASLRVDADGGLALAVRFAALTGIALVACGRIAAGTYSPFIYFRF